MRTAIIDLGTNTCNLLIAEINGKNFRILHQSKQLVKLGDDKIRTNEISTEAMHRILDAFKKHRLISEEFCADKIKVIATSAVRSAVNKNELLAAIRDKTGWTAEIISGEKEAELIFNGVLLAFGSFQQPSVILDIGGGSNELILAAGRKMMWKESQSAGMGRVINRFMISDPVQSDEIKQLQHFFSLQHKAGLKKCKEHKVEVLIGCSGAFDTVADIIDQVDPGEKKRITQVISLSDFHRVYQKLLSSNRRQRMSMKGMDNVRVDLIVPAVIFIGQLISLLGIKQIIQTDFALREGVLAEIMAV